MEVTRTRSTPIFVDVDGKTRISTGRWNDKLMVQYVVENDDRWISVGELARVAWGSNNLHNKHRVRANLSRMFKLALEVNKLLAIEYEALGRHPAKAVKVCDKTKVYERDLVSAKVDKLFKARELSEAMYKLAHEMLTSVDSQIDDE